MTDITLDFYLVEMTNAERVAWTPVPGPAPGPPGKWLLPIVVESDTGAAFYWDQENGGAWAAWTGSVGLKGSDIASAATIAIGLEDFYHVTGTTTITDIDFTQTRAGRYAVLVFDGVLTLTHNATSLILPTGANIVTAAGDSCVVRSEGGDNVRVVSYQRKDGKALDGWTLIASSAPSGVATVTFGSGNTLPQTYKALKLIGVVRSQAAGTGTDIVKMRFNGDTGSNYQHIVGVFANSFANGFESTETGVIVGEAPKASEAANYPGSIHAEILSYVGTTFYKNTTGKYGTQNGGSVALCYENWWLNTAAITQIDLLTTSGSNFTTGTEFYLFGLS